MPTPAEFLTKFPEFTGTPNERIQLWLDFAACLICTSQFKQCAQDWAHCLLAAHYLKLDLARQADDIEDQSDAIDGVASLGVGDVNVSFDTGKVTAYYEGISKDAITRELATTNYGRMYLSLLRRTGRMVMTTGMC